MKLCPGFENKLIYDHDKRKIISVATGLSIEKGSIVVSDRVVLEVVQVTPQYVTEAFLNRKKYGRTLYFSGGFIKGNFRISYDNTTIDYIYTFKILTIVLGHFIGDNFRVSSLKPKSSLLLHANVFDIVDIPFIKEMLHTSYIAYKKSEQGFNDLLQKLGG